MYNTYGVPKLSSLIRLKEALDGRAGSNKNVPNYVIYTPPASPQDKTSSVGTATMEDEWPDNRPSTCPYTTPIFHLIIGPSNVQYTIHQYFLDQSPEWAAKCRSKPWGNKISLPDVDEDISHALIHYLYSGAYQTLNGLEGSGKACKIDWPLEYKRSIRLYCVAKTYGLLRLETLCKGRIEGFKDGISIWDTLDIAEEAYKKISSIDDLWFSMYLKGKMQAAINDDKRLLTRKKFLERSGRTTEFDKALMKIIAQIYTGGNGLEEYHEDDEDENGTPNTKRPSDGENY